MLIAAAVCAAGCSAQQGATSTNPEPAPAAATTTVEPTSTTSAAPRVDLDVQGHRGARGLRPENTLPAFEIALDLGVTTLELDTHLTADDRVVVWHDPAIDPEKCGLAGDGAELPDPGDPAVDADDLMVRRLTADQVRSYRCDRNPNVGRFPDQSNAPTMLAGDDFGIVTLDELFEFVDDYALDTEKTDSQRKNAAAVAYNIETKRKPTEPETIGDGFDGVNAGTLELEILRSVEAHDLSNRVSIQSFDHRSLWAVASETPSVDLVALTLVGSVDFDELVRRGADVWSPNRDQVSEETVVEAQGAGLVVIPWTVNDVADMEWLVALGVDGLISDRPDLALEVVGRP